MSLCGPRSRQAGPTAHDEIRQLEARECDALSVERVGDPRRLAELAESWDALIEDDEPGAVFRSTAWLLPWWRHFGAGKELCLYTVCRGDRLVGVLPTYCVRTALGHRQLRLIGDGVVGSDYLGVLARRADLEAVSEKLARTLLAQEVDLVFEGVAADDPLLAKIKAGAQAQRLPCAAALLEFCPLVRISGRFEDWLRERPHGAGAQFSRRLRWLERQPGFRIDVFDGEREIASALPILWRLHHAAWAGRGGSSVELGGPATIDFQEASAVALARRGWARLFVLHVAGAPRAALYGFERGGRFAYYQSGYDPTWGQRSVGRVMLGEVLRTAFARGLKEFDFLRGDEEYKWLFASESRSIVRLHVAISRAALPSWVLDQGWRTAKYLARDVLPPSGREWVRRKRRRVKRWAAQRGSGRASTIGVAGRRTRLG